MIDVWLLSLFVCFYIILYEYVGEEWKYYVQHWIFSTTLSFGTNHPVVLSPALIWWATPTFISLTCSVTSSASWRAWRHNIYKPVPTADNNYHHILITHLPNSAQFQSMFMATITKITYSCKVDILNYRDVWKFLLSYWVFEWLAFFV